MEAVYPFNEVQGEVVPTDEPVPRLEEVDEVLCPEVEWRPHVEPDSRVAVFDEDFVPPDFRDAAVKREFRHGPPSRPRSLRELRHDHVLHGLHRTEVQNDAALRVRLQEPRLDALRRLHEERLNPPGLRL